MNLLGFILRKEFRQIFRDKTILAMMFLVPTMQLVILPLAMNFEVKNVNVVIVDHDHSSYTQRLIAKINSSGYFTTISYENSYLEAFPFIEDGNADIILELPAGFERNLLREGMQKVGIFVDAINGTKASLGGAYLNAVIADF